MFFLNKKPLHPGFSRNDDAAFCSSLRNVSFSTSVSSPAMLCRNKNIRCNVIANRLPESPSFSRMLKRRCGNLLLRNGNHIHNVISRNEVISTLEIATKTPLMFFLNKKLLHPGFSRNDDAAFVHYCGGCPSVHQCLHRPCYAETKTSGVTSLRIAFLNHYHSQNAQRRCGNLILQKQKHHS
jgi:hypothetical protein